MNKLYMVDMMERRMLCYIAIWRFFFVLFIELNGIACRNLCRETLTCSRFGDNSLLCNRKTENCPPCLYETSDSVSCFDLINQVCPFKNESLCDDDPQNLILPNLPQKTTSSPLSNLGNQSFKEKESFLKKKKQEILFDENDSTLPTIITSGSSADQNADTLVVPIVALTLGVIFLIVAVFYTTKSEKKENSIMIGTFIESPSHDDDDRVSHITTGPIPITLAIPKPKSESNSNSKPKPIAYLNAQLKREDGYFVNSKRNEIPKMQSLHASQKHLGTATTSTSLSQRHLGTPSSSTTSSSSSHLETEEFIIEEEQDYWSDMTSETTSMRSTDFIKNTLSPNIVEEKLWKKEFSM